MEVSRLQVAFEATGQSTVQSAVKKTDSAIKNLAANSEGSAKRVGSAFASAGNAIKVAFGAVAAVGIGKALSSFISMNAQAEQYHQSLEVVTGSQERANALFDKLQGFAASTPFEFPELVQASINLESFGMKTEDWIGTIGDTASAMGKSVDQVTQAVLDASTGEYERIKELGIKARVEGDKVVLSYLENGKAVTETVDKTNQAVIASTIQAIWNKKYAGAMKKQSKTFNGQMSTFKDNVKMTMAEATKPIFNFAKDGLDAANRLLSRFSDKRAMGLGVWQSAMSSLHTTLDQTFGKSAGDAIIGVIRGIGSAVSNITGAIGDLGGLLLSGDIGGFFSQLGSDLLAVAQQTVFKIPSLAVDVVQWVAGKIPDVWGWLKGIITNRTQVQGDGTGGPEPGTRSISIGQVLVDVAGLVAGTIAGWAADTGTKIQTWIDGHKPGSFVTAIDLRDFNVAFAAGAEGRWDVAVVDLLTADPIKVTPEIELNISQAVEDWVRNPNIPDISAKWALAAPLIFANLPLALSIWAAKNTIPDIAKVIRGVFTGAFEGLFTDKTTMVPGINIARVETGVFTPIIEMLKTGWEGLKSALTIDLSGIPIPGLPGWLTNLDWITGPIGKLETAYQTLIDLRNKIPFVGDETEATTPTGSTGLPGVGVAGMGAGPSGGGGGGRGRYEPANIMKDTGGTSAFSIPAPDFSAFTTAMTTVATQATTAQTSVMKSFLDMQKTTEASTTAMAGGLTNQFIRLSSGATQQANAMSMSVSNAFNAMRNNAVNAAGSLVSGVLGQLSVLPGAGFGIGASLGYGIASGISATVSAVANAAANVVNAAVSAARAAGGIASPSKVMMEMGGYMTEGFAIGMARGMPMVNRSMDGLVRGVPRSAAGRGGGTTIINKNFIIEKGAFVGRHAESEIEQMAASGAAKVVDQRFASTRASGRS